MDNHIICLKIAKNNLRDVQQMSNFETNIFRYMDKIVLTPEQREVIQEYLDGKIGMFNATEHQQKIIIQILDDAKALLNKLDAWDELGDNWDLIRWYLTKVE